MAKDSISNGDALKANTAALAAHTQALNQSTAALVAHAAALTPSTVKQFVYGVLGAPLTLPDTTTLAALGWDAGSLPGLAAKINDQDWHGVEVDVGAIQRCGDISDVVAVVAAAEA
jgi:hypothetical protein